MIAASETGAYWLGWVIGIWTGGMWMYFGLDLWRSYRNRDED